MKANNIISVLLLFFLIIGVFSCSKKNYQEQAELFVGAKNLKIERIVSGIPSETISYRVIFDVEFYRRSKIKLETVTWGSHQATVWQMEESGVLSAVNFHNFYVKGQTKKLIAVFNNIKVSELPEKLDDEGKASDRLPLFLDFSKKRYNKSYKLDLGEVKKTKNYLGE
jgi:hypothetical protein